MKKKYVFDMNLIIEATADEMNKIEHALGKIVDELELKAERFTIDQTPK